MKKLKKVFLIIIVLVTAAYMGLSIYIAHEMTKPVARELAITGSEISPVFEEITFTDKDNLTLRGWFFPGSTSRAIVMVSGILNNRVDPGYMTPQITKELLGLGYSVLIYDHRATGTSDGTRVSYGQHESSGVLRAVGFLEGRGFLRGDIGIIANSMGTAAVLEGITELADIGPIVLDSSPADIAQTASHILSTERGVPAVLHPGIYYFTKAFFKADLRSVRPIEKIKQAKGRQFLFLHGGLDKSVLPENSEKLWELAAPGSKLVIFPKGKHIETYKTDSALYSAEVFGFLDEGF